MRKHTNPIDEWLAGAFGAIFPAIPKPDSLGMGTVELEEEINKQKNHR